MRSDSERDDLRWLGGAINTLEAPGFALWLAYRYGHRIEDEDGVGKCIGYYWRGKLYLADFVEQRTQKGGEQSDRAAQSAPTADEC
ncbi:MAG: hypothetical protein ACLPXW_20345 [Xanthobacteraceae bacterium]